MCGSFLLELEIGFWCMILCAWIWALIRIDSSLALLEHPMIGHVASYRSMCAHLACLWSLSICGCRLEMLFVTRVRSST